MWRSSSSPRGRSARRATSDRRGQPALERLDDRLLLDAGFARGIATIRGTLGPDPATIETVNLVDRAPAHHAGSDGATDHGRRGGVPGRNEITASSLIPHPSSLPRREGAPGRNDLTADGARDRMRNGVAAPHPLRFASAEKLRRFLVRSAIRRNGSSDGNRLLEPSPGAPAAAPTPTAGAVTAAPSHSNTNVQVPGVDEADIVKTDGNFLYILSRQELLIVAARPAESVAIASRNQVEGYPVAEYLDGDRLTVVSAVYGDPIPIDAGPGGTTRLIAPISAYSPPRVKVTQYNVSKPAAPQVLEETFLDGSYIDSRSTDGKVYVALQNDAGARVQPRFLPAADGQGGTYETQAAFQARVRKAKLSELAPRFTTRTGGPEGPIVRSGLLTDPRDTLRPLAADDQNLLSLVVFDARAAAHGPIGSASAVGSYATTLYASKDNLYLLTPRGSADGSGGSTTITKFSLVGGVQLAASGAVPGQVLNQFSVDEFDGHLRIATTVDHSDVNRGEGVRSTNNLYVLDQAGAALAVVGRLEDLAPNERIFSARFDGTKGYLVTFEQVDPLFTVDLSNPRAPKVVGTLVLPGFSRYLQPIGPSLLLGFGRDADPATGRTRGLQLSLFDVSDLANPRRVAHTLIDPPSQQWSWTDAEYDHHAISYFPEQQILTIPVSGSVPGADGDGDGFPDSYDFKSSLYVYRVDPAAGFRLLGTIDHDSTVERAVRIEDDLYSLADRTLKVNQLGAALTPLGSVTLQTGDQYSGGGPIVALGTPAAVG